MMSHAEDWAYLFAIICYAPMTSISLPVAQQQAPAAVQQAPVARTSTVLSRPLPELNGKNLSVQVVRVHYGPGESSNAHSHPCPVVGYVLEGAVRMQVQDAGKQEAGPVTVYRAGESFYEAPNARHLVSANASQSEPATFLATFVCDHPTPLTVPSPDKNGAGR